MNILPNLRAALAGALLLLSAEALALSYEGRVTRVSDADTVTVSVTSTCREADCPTVGRSLRVRFAEIDAPESDQPYGDMATQHLGAVIDGQVVAIEQTGIDHRNDRVVGQIIYQGTWINGWLVAEGHAWVYPQYAETAELFKLEEAARSARRGLWAADNPMEPWLWRRK